MDDSPLSITSSVTGILTFVVAILAAIYIRYTTLMNGQNEMHSILESIIATVQETGKLSLEGNSGQDPENAHMRNLLTELYSTELSILGQLAGVTRRQVERKPEDLSRDSPAEALERIVREAMEYIESVHLRENSPLGLLSSIVPSSALTPSLEVTLKAMQFLASFGTTPALMYWYRVRKNVLENVRKRENIRSRLLFLQVSEAHAASKAQNKMLEYFNRRFDEAFRMENEGFRRLEERLHQVEGSSDQFHRAQRDMHELTIRAMQDNMDRLASHVLNQNEEMMRNLISNLTTTLGHDREASLEKAATMGTDCSECA